MDNICYSGGAVGADSLFGELAAKAGHKVIHWAFAEQGSKVPKETLNRLPYGLLIKADPWLKRTNVILKRTFPTRSVYTNNLLRRNYFQVKTTERVYAITRLDENNGIPQGGTGWAIVMGILLKVPEIYVFDPDANFWNKFDNFNSRFNQITWEAISSPPLPYGRYTGIGNIDLTESGINAIRGLYEQRK